MFVTAIRSGLNSAIRRRNFEAKVLLKHRTSLRCSRPTHYLDHLYGLVRLRISAQKLVMISSSVTRICYRERTPSRLECLCKICRLVFPASSSRCRCTAAYSAISLLASVKTNQEMSIFTDKKTHICSYSGPGISEKTKKLRLYI